MIKWILPVALVAMMMGGSSGCSNFFAVKSALDVGGLIIKGTKGDRRVPTLVVPSEATQEERDQLMQEYLQKVDECDDCF
ncbi:MAG: hypothetical protein VYA17_07395 [Pseudomonadota bacterium]|nr:hypothetical protein [Pseudomonadota bacterium]